MYTHLKVDTLGGVLVNPGVTRPLRPVGTVYLHRREDIPKGLYGSPNPSLTSLTVLVMSGLERGDSPGIPRGTVDHTSGGGPSP